LEAVFIISSATRIILKSTAIRKAGAEIKK
jgi:hypothetical protein